MSDYIINVFDNGNEYKIIAKENDNLLTLLQRKDIPIHAPCAGKGTCKKCMVNIESVGEVLACQTLVNDNLVELNSKEIVVKIPKRSEHRILTNIDLPKHNINPIIKYGSVKIDIPTVDNQIPDDERIYNATGKNVPFNQLSQLSKFLRHENFEFTYFYRTDTNEITSFQTLQNNNTAQGIAIDIGSTTIAGILYDLYSGKQIKISSRLNSQRNYGADIISRIDFADTSYDNLKKLQKLVYDDIMELIFDLTENVKDIKSISFAGNTTMMHLLSAINPVAIAKAPFIPTTLKQTVCYFTQLFNNMEDKILFDPLCILLPSISGYVGADITAGIITCNMDVSIKPTFLVDIGTNGEIALSVNGKITACSTAAGPAFEGANLSCGIGGVVGAIDKVEVIENNIQLSTIGDEEPIGICGSGVVSAISILLQMKVIDETGRFEDNNELFSEDTKNRFIEVSGQKAFVLHYDNGNPKVYLSQKDIREIQNAKAAVCAGLNILMERENLKPNDIDKVYIAGGFGNFLNIDDAFIIGMLPYGLKGKTIMSGNTSLSGASICLLDIDSLNRGANIRNITQYYELSSDKRFTDLYIDAMMFE